MPNPGIRLALISPHDEVLASWDEVEIARRAIERELSRRLLGRLAFLKPKKRAAIEETLRQTIIDCFTDLARAHPVPSGE